jgi:hypothetical protein
MHLGVEEEAFINESLLFYGVGWRYTTLSLRLSHSTAHTQIWVCVRIPIPDQYRYHRLLTCT